MFVSLFLFPDIAIKMLVRAKNMVKVKKYVPSVEFFAFCYYIICENARRLATEKKINY